MGRPRKHQDPREPLPPCVYKKHGAFWLVKGGKWTKLGRTHGEALLAHAQIYSTHKGGMKALIDEALPHILRTVKPSTARQYGHAARTLSRKFMQFAPEQVQPRHVAQFKADMAGKPNMCNRCLSLLRQVFDYALERQLIDSNPAVGIKRHREAKRTRLLSLEEYSAIYQHAGPRLQIIMDLCIRTGQRISDVLKIRRADADLAGDGIRFQQMKTGTRLVVPWTPELRAVVERAKGLPGNIRGLTLLCNRRGKSPDYRTVKLQWDKARKAAGIEDARLHDMRAMAATWARKQGKDPTALLGHSSSAQTERYLRDRAEIIAESPDFRQSNRQAKKIS